MKNKWADLNHSVHRTSYWRHGTSIYALALVLEADILSMLCKDDVTYYAFDDF